MVSFPEELLELLSNGDGSQNDETSSITSNLWKDCNNAVEVHFNISVPQQHQSLPSTIEATLSEAGDKLSAVLMRDDNQEPSSLLLSEEWLRATKNILRWNLTFCDPNTCFATTLQSREVLKVCMSYLTRSVSNDQVIRYATLSLFYATLSEPKLSEYVVQDLQYLDMFAHILTTTTSQSVLLAALRLVHNLLVTHPKTASIVMKKNRESIVALQADEGEGSTVLVPWLQSASSSLSPPAKSIYGLMICLLEYCLLAPTEIPDRRIELRTELLRIFYVLQAGKVMSSTLLHQLLHFPDNEVRLSAVTLLMDALVLEFDDASFTILLNTLQQQVTLVVEQTLVGSTAASVITPILIVLRKHCMTSTDAHSWRKATKDTIFPNPIDLSAVPNNNKNKLSPKDAPRGTLRWKCIQLLTWTQGHIKRCTGELLWVLCDQNADEYTNRVGLGNAMPLLQAKGYMEQQQGGSVGVMDLNNMVSS